jgi:hypothetical protein
MALEFAMVSSDVIPIIGAQRFAQSLKRAIRKALDRLSIQVFFLSASFLLQPNAVCQVERRDINGFWCKSICLTKSLAEQTRLKRALVFSFPVTGPLPLCGRPRLDQAAQAILQKPQFFQGHQ